MSAQPSIRLRWQGYYEYTQKNIKKYVLKDPRLIGVYKLAELETFGRLIPFYISETNNLYKDLKKNLENPPNDCVKQMLEDKICCFKFAPLLEEEERKDVIYTLYNTYKPKCNDSKKISQGTLLKINLNF